MKRIDVENKTILITGAAHGLGRELALRLDALGCALSLTDRDPAGLALLAGALSRPPQTSVCDLSDLNERKNLIQAVNAGPKPDILINCAGMGSHSKLSQLDVGEIGRVLQVNLLAPLEMTASLSPLELIVNIGSVAGEMHLPSMSLYSASKASLHAFSRSIQLEGVRTLLVILGPMRGTDFVQGIKNPRLGQPKWYRDLDLDAGIAAEEIIRAMINGKDQVILPRWYRPVFGLARLVLPLMRASGRRFG